LGTGELERALRFSDAVTVEALGTLVSTPLGMASPHQI